MYFIHISVNKYYFFINQKMTISVLDKVPFLK